MTRSRQHGMGIFGILGVLAMLGFFAMCIIKMTPPYLEFLSIRDIVTDIVKDPDSVDKSSSEIRRKLDYTFNTNQIYELDWKDVEVYRKKGRHYIDARYEVRMPIMWRIDAVLKFDDLLFEIGDPTPLTTSP
ncbi:MAG: DUF4845 domain-containing protein [Gammaproteobacteria bacterium]|nr:DUF4845 domain-containing protein [Gammaproteobacteria bacterium]